MSGSRVFVPDVFDRQEALRRGFTAWTIRTRLASGEWVELRPGVYAEAAALRLADADATQLVAVQSALAGVSSLVVVSHESAARLHGLPLPRSARQGVVLTREPNGRHAKLDGAEVHAARLPESHRCLVHDLPVTTPARTVVDLARRWRSDGDALALADAALRSGAANRTELQTVLHDCVSWPGIRRAQSIVPFGDACGESPLESVSRLMMLRRDIPEPQLQVEIYDQWGFVARSDFGWLQSWTVGECDGMIKYADNPEALIAEKRRQERLERLGLVVVRWGWDDAVQRADSTCERIRRGLRAGVERNAGRPFPYRVRLHASRACDRSQWWQP